MTVSVGPRAEKGRVAPTALSHCVAINLGITLRGPLKSQ